MSASTIPPTQQRRGTMSSMDAPHNSRRRVSRLAAGSVAAGVAAAAYMAFEAQWVICREADLPVSGLPVQWSGLTILHLSDIHAGSFRTNERSLGRVVRWAAPLSPDLVVLTGDILGDRDQSRVCLDLLARLRPHIGMFAVTGNHEYGLGKGPLARPRDTRDLWREAGVTLLSDTCVSLPPREASSVVLCGADYLSGGYGLLAPDALPEATTTRSFPILLAHRPPPSDSPLARLFPLAFAGHTHGGQLRVPGPSGLTPLHNERDEHLAGIHSWGAGLIVISRGVGTSFLPFRLLTRPEATLWRLVYTSPTHSTAPDH
jgi:predicted MPP superfamily phosphohydrolase